MVKSLMKKIILLGVSFGFFQGCLTFHRISYEIDLKDELRGKGTIRIYDIRSNAETDEEFNEDKSSLFNYMLKNEGFISDMKSEGKDIISRRLYRKDDLLHAEVKFNFEDVNKVEGIVFEDGFYYLTMEIEDSIYSTNGEVIFSDSYKRIVWDQKIKSLLFDIIATDYNDSNYKKLAPFYKE